MIVRFIIKVVVIGLVDVVVGKGFVDCLVGLVLDKFVL